MGRLTAATQASSLAAVMRLDQGIVESLLVKPGVAADLARRETSGANAIGNKVGKRAATQTLRGFTSELAAAQELLYASASKAVLVVLQGLDTSGKDGTIKHVMSGVNPQGCSVASFKQPSALELSHSFLWRAVAKLPPRGYIGIFNRSYYEDVLVVRVHPELLDSQHLGPASPKLWRHRYEEINAFERHLHRNGTHVLKLFLHISKEEQRRRLLERLDNPAKHWKFSPSDVTERGYWDDYQAAYEHALTATSTKWAPWYVIPADEKPVARALVAGVLVHAVDDLELTAPRVGPDQKVAIKEAKALLQAE